MIPLEHAFRYAIYLMLIILLGALIADFGNRNHAENNDPIVPLTEAPPDKTSTKIIVDLPNPTPAPIEKTETYRERLNRYDVFRSKVLLTERETNEKHRLLAHLKTVQWVEKQLTTIPETDDLGPRLMMIDFLEDTLSWKENPIRSEILDSVERTLQTNNIRGSEKLIRQMLVGDKVELYAVLAEEEPTRARALLDSTKDKRLIRIFQYAIRRLGLWKKLAEGGQ